jgi:hypothetical protein
MKWVFAVMMLGLAGPTCEGDGNQRAIDDYWRAAQEARECKADDECVIISENAPCTCPVAVNAAAAERLEAMAQALECEYDIICARAEEPRCEDDMCAW